MACVTKLAVGRFGRRGLRAPAEHATHQQATRRRVAEERVDKVAVAVEGGRAPDNRHDAVGARQLEQAVDFVVRQVVGDFAERGLRAQFVAELFAPPLFVDGERGLVELVQVQGGGEDLRGKVAAQQAVINAAPTVPSRPP